MVCYVYGPYEDYARLQWVLERSRPRAVTLECWYERALLQEQLQRLRQMLNDA